VSASMAILSDSLSTTMTAVNMATAKTIFIAYIGNIVMIKQI
jgi:hypothetical protein